MKITKKDLKNSSVEFHIELDDKDMKSSRTKAIEHFSQNLKIPGFRKGHITETVILQHTSEAEISEETVKQGLQMAYVKALKKEKIEPISQPKVNIEKKAPLTFKITVETLPQINLGKYKDIKISTKKNSISKKEIDDVLKELQTKVPSFKEVKRAAKNGDQVIIDFEGFTLKDEAVANTKAEKQSLELGSKSLIPGFEEEVEGLKAGEGKTFKITFPKEYQAKDMAGNTYKFKIYIHSVEEKSLPELNEEFVEKITGKKDSIDFLKNEIEKNLLLKKEQEERKELEEKVLEELGKKIKFEVPDVLISEETNFLIDNVKMGGLQQGLPWEKYLEAIKKTEEELRKEMKKDAEKRVKYRLIIQEIVKKENFQVDEKAVHTAAHQSLARLNPEDQKKQHDAYHPGGKNYEQIKNMFLVNKAFDLFIK
ncbi:trigger factor [Candidatus Peregrinibacteria bacterium]|jgi:trigger factor|nr:trigger factor [Candidatus Peregrinibacteria bacterium]